jgi:hypothetical protein
MKEGQKPRRAEAQKPEKLMMYEQISPVMRNFVGSWECFRKLGFSADDLHCLIAPSAQHGHLACFLRLATEGKEFLVEIGGPVDKGTIQNEYEEVSTAVSDGRVSSEVLDRLYEECEIYQMKVPFIFALQSKGFSLRKTNLN